MIKNNTYYGRKKMKINTLNQKLKSALINLFALGLVASATIALSSPLDVDASTSSSGKPMIFSTSSAFAALKSDSSVVTWGDSERGGDSSAVGHKISSDVTEIFSTSSAFAALKSDGSVVTWEIANKVEIHPLLDLKSPLM